MRFRVLLVTEKCSPSKSQRDGGFRVVETLKQGFKKDLSVMQFGPGDKKAAAWRYDYPYDHPNRFERRLVNADFIAKKVKAVEEQFTHVIFSHISMQFGQVKLPLKEKIKVWTFPMFLTPSYRAAGEIVPESYVEMERLVLQQSKNILTPSYLEKQQLIEFYFVAKETIHVVPRGINTKLLNPKKRDCEGLIKFCSLGSIKPQKDTLGMVRLFFRLRKRFPTATLSLIGPVQNHSYFASVKKEIERLCLQDFIDFKGPIPPEQLSCALKEAHIHLSTARSETFGRSIFETLALGLPNVAYKQGNAAAEFLQELPYVYFVENDDQAIQCIEKIFQNYSKLSSMAQEVGNFFDDALLSQLIIAKICQKDVIAISDFDGTLYHKNDVKKTERCIEAFKKFPKRVICSARSIDDIVKKIAFYNLEVDWIIGFSGGVIADGKGKTLWQTPLKPHHLSWLNRALSDGKPVKYKRSILQIASEEKSLPPFFDMRKEVYEGKTFILPWEASKFRAVHKLLQRINWSGRVRAFGDGAYDSELLRYFDGTFMSHEQEVTFGSVFL